MCGSSSYAAETRRIIPSAPPLANQDSFTLLAGCPPAGPHAILSVCAASEPDRQQREKTAHQPGQGADHENQGEKALP